MLRSLRPPSRVVRAALAGALMALLATGCSPDAPARTTLVTAVPNASWTDCFSEDACEARWLTCRGWQAVNREHGKQVEAWYARVNREYLSRADCDGRPLTTPQAYCRVERCTLE